MQKQTVTLWKIKSNSSPCSCIYCHSTIHSPSTCNTVYKQQKRLNIVRKENLCFNCLGQNRVAQCKSKWRCKICKRKHHTSLCANTDKQDNVPTLAKSESNPLTPSTSTPAQSTTGLTVSLPPNPSLTNAVPSNIGCLLKTAVAIAWSGDHQCYAHVLFDEGAQR